MKLEKGIFDIDTARYIDRLSDFIRGTYTRLHRRGIVVPFSGGVDSSTVLLLCLRAVGRKHVTALLMPEKQGNPEAERYSNILTEANDIHTITRDISPILADLGVYEWMPFRSLQNLAARTYLKSARENPFLKIVRGEANDFERTGFARFNTKHRARALMIYLVAEEMNYLVVGCAHKSEDMLGLYVKFGVDDSADVMPLKNLYRSHILQLAASLGVPEEIINRTPNPDIIPGVSDKYMDILGLPSDTLDLIVYGIEHGLEVNDIATQLNLPIEKVGDIRDLVQQTEHMRNHSQSLTWEQLTA